MITLKQTERCLLGAKRDIDSLAKKESARILVLSDSHGQRELFRLIVEKAGPSCDALVFCGDGAGDFVSCMDDAASDAAFAEFVPPVAAFVEGNGDADRFPVRFNPAGKKSSDVFYELIIPKRQILQAAGHIIYAVHGHEQGAYYGTEALERECEAAGADIALYGHTHIAVEMRRGVYVVNPGSISYPRSLTPPSFAVLELDGKNSNAVFYRIDVHLDGIRFTPFIPKKTSLRI
ncbi:MJ0936 family phosphodiesterase [Treponema socranskii subsp. paredis ATCC 35535]|nr:MJ0936 family phosphodiesterase [Treponema socranskii subsp. paredis ATCC 35535]